MDLENPKCPFWSKRMTNKDLKARRCASQQLVPVPTPKGKTLLICRQHRAEFLQTGKVRTKVEANQPYSTRIYRPTEWHK